MQPPAGFMVTWSASWRGVPPERAPQQLRLHEVNNRQRMFSCEASGAGEGIRTLDPNLGKVVLYP